MCGIAGIRTAKASPSIDSQKVHHAIGAIAHRGPDNQGFFNSSNLALGHSRLSIIDPSELANQPMTFADERYVLVFNGEIYNHRELRVELERGGTSFITNSDTEVLLHTLIKHGKNALTKLNGCFAFAFSDKQENTLLLARDRMGINPFWYATPGQDGSVCFASEMKALKHLIPQVELNPEALPFYLRFNYLPTEVSFYKDVHKLPPGHFLWAEGNRVTVEKWYDLASTFQSEDQAPESLLKVLTDAVHDRLISDVPLGSFLSGGIDSSIVAALAAQAHPGIETFSVGFEGGDLFDETHHAKLVADHIGSKHHSFNMNMEQLAEEASQLAQSLDEPFADSSALPMSFLSRQTRQRVTVALSGDGADELFAGYRKHRGHLKAVQWNSPGYKSVGRLTLGLTPKLSSRSKRLADKVRKVRKLAEGMQLDADQRYLQWASFAQNEFLEACGFSVQDIEPQLTNISQLTELQRVLLNDQLLVLPNDMLHKVDLMSMRHSLEVRTPFLDHRVVEWANSAADKHKFGPKQGKAILREACRGLLPSSIFERPKQGFEIPLEGLLLGALREEISPLAQKNTLEELGIPQPEGAAKMIERFLAGHNPGLAPTVWALYALSSWLKVQQTGMK